MTDYDFIIIGGGPAGMGAAIYAARYRMKTLVICAEAGGLINEAHVVENYPGFESISGFDLMVKVHEQAKKLGIEVKETTVEKIEKTKDEFLVSTSKEKITGKTVLLAIGTKRRKLNVKGEKEFTGKGVSYCATCDGAFFRDKTVGVVGGSDSAASAAILLAQHAKKIIMIYRGDALRAEPVWIEQIEKNDKIDVIYNANVVELIGEPFLKKVKLDNGNEVELDGLFIEIGTVPGTALTEPLGVKTDKRNYIIVDIDMNTNIKGVYAAGDISTASNMKQMITAFGQGATAAYSAFKMIKAKK